MVEDIQYDSLDTGISKGTHSDSMTISTITFNQFRDVIMVVYARIVHDNHTTRSGIWHREGQLIAKYTAQNEHITNERTHQILPEEVEEEVPIERSFNNLSRNNPFIQHHASQH
jgi:hypothetical protein